MLGAEPANEKCIFLIPSISDRNAWRERQPTPRSMPRLMPPPAKRITKHDELHPAI